MLGGSNKSANRKSPLLFPQYHYDLVSSIIPLPLLSMSTLFLNAFCLYESTLVGASGEMSDFQSILEMLEGIHQSDVNQDDGYTRSPAEFFNYLRAVLYQRRNKGNPLWNQLLVAGCRDDKPFLGYVVSLSYIH